MCNVMRSDKDLDTCPYCYKSYLFFAKDLTRMSVHENRFNDETELIYMK